MSIFRLSVRHSRHVSAVYRRLLHVSMRLSHASTVVNESVKHCYAILNVSATCSNDELRTAYLVLVKKYHPDSISGQANADQFAQVEDAYRRILIHRRDVELTNAVEEGKETTFDIKHTAPQHRQYLEYGGAGYGMPSQRQRQHQQQQVIKAADSVFDYRTQKIAALYENSMITKDKQETRKRTMRSAIDRLVEDLIVESIAKGDFDNLPGKGKPLHYSHDNPYVDAMTHNINKILINNGYVPPWVTLEKEIREDIRRAREELRAARLALCQVPSSPVSSRLWKQKQAEFYDRVADINMKVDRLNMIVPTLYQQIARFDIAKEQQTIAEEQSTPQSTPAQDDQQQSSANNNSVTFTDVLRELKALFTT